MYLEMIQSELIQHLYDEINRQDTWYMWTVGILVTVIVLVVGFYSYQQWRFSDKGIKKMQEKFKKEFHDEFFKEFHDEFFKEFKKEYGIEELREAIHKANEENKKSMKLQRDIKEEINKSLEISLLSLSSQFESIDKESDTYIVNNKLLGVKRFFENKDLRVFSEKSIRSAIITMSNGLLNLLENDFAWNETASLRIKKINEYFHEAYNGFKNPKKSTSSSLKKWDEYASKFEKRKPKKDEAK